MNWADSSSEFLHPQDLVLEAGSPASPKMVHIGKEWLGENFISLGGSELEREKDISFILTPGFFCMLS